MKNIDQFNEIAGLVFAELFESFPLRNDLSPTEIANAKEEYDFKIAYETIRWLSAYGYIETSGGCLNGDCQATLTPKGFGVLNVIPEGIKEKSSSYGQLITEAAKETALEQGKKGLGELAAKAIAYGVTSLGNVVS